jgi:MSHA biogenesis protein MshQ
MESTESIERMVALHRGKRIGSLLLLLTLALIGVSGRALAATHVNPTGIGCTLSSGTIYNCSSGTYSTATNFSGGVYTLNFSGTVTVNANFGTSTYPVNFVSTGLITVENNVTIYGDLTSTFSPSGTKAIELKNNVKIYGDITANSGMVTLGNSNNTDVFGNLSAAKTDMGNNAYVTGNCSTSACTGSCNSTLPANSNCASTQTAPLVASLGSTGNTTTSATLQATITPNQTNVTSILFDYSTDTSYGTSCAAPSASTLTASANSTVVTCAPSATLTCGTTYNFRVKATNTAGTTTATSTFATTACASGPDHYELSVPSSSISCLASTVTVTACATSATSVTGTPCTAYTTSMNGKTATLATNAGTLGSTTVTFNASGVATTTLSYPTLATGTTATATVTLSGESQATTVPNTRKCCPNGIACTTASSCGSTFDTAGFIFSSTTGGAAATLPTTTSGATSGTYYLRAVQSNASTQKCESALTGAQSITFGYACDTPASCSVGSYLDVSGTAVSAAGSPATSLTFDANGNAPFTFRYRDAGQIHLTASKAAGGSLLTALSGTSNTFTVNPAYFTTVLTTPACSGSITHNSITYPGFTYSGQPITTVTVTARESSAAAATPNYTGTVTLSDAGTATNFTSNTISSFTAGAGTASPKYTFGSKTAVPTPLTLRASDGTTSSSGYTEATALIVSGRVRMTNANGSELLALPIPVYVEYYKTATAAWQTNTSDTSCTTLSPGNFALSFPSTSANHLAACETSATVSGSPPIPTVSLTKPGTGNDGWADVTLNLGSSALGSTCVSGSAATDTAANKSWLQYNWTGTESNPTSGARFGTVKSGPTIHQRELF